MRNSKFLGVSIFTLETTLTVGVAAAAGLGVANWGGQGGATLAATAAGAVAGNVLGNFVDRLLVRSSKAMGVLLPWGQVHEMPINQDLARAMRASLIDAVEAVVEDAVREDAADNAEADRTAWARCNALEVFRRQVGRWARRERRLGLRRESSDPTLNLLWGVLPDIVAVQTDGSEAAAEAGMVWEHIAKHLIAELRTSGVTWIPERVELALSSSDLEDDELSGWQAFQRYFLDRVKKDQAVYRVIALDFDVRTLRALKRARGPSLLALLKPKPDSANP